MKFYDWNKQITRQNKIWRNMQKKCKTKKTIFYNYKSKIKRCWKKQLTYLK